EIGRGGMGIVYEAEQEALGRHVALKVLPANAAANTRCLLRFRREARSAARLHHTNIVPAFDIGERGGIHYYAIQFIQGEGLDGLTTDFRRLRANSNAREVDAGNGSAPASAAAGLAESLLSGQFRIDGEALDLAFEKARLPLEEVAAGSPPFSGG